MEWAAALNQVFKIGIKTHKTNGGGLLDKPAADLKRVRIKQKELQLPEPAYFFSSMVRSSM